IDDLPQRTSYIGGRLSARSKVGRTSSQRGAPVLLGQRGMLQTEGGSKPDVFRRRKPMSTPLVVTRAPERVDQSVLNKVLIAALLGNVLVNAVLQALVLHTLIVPLTVIMALTVVVAGVIATRWRWAPLLAALWCVLGVIPGLPPYTYNL